MGYAVDYQGAIDLTLSGNGKLQASPIPNGFPGAAGLPLPVHDVTKAKALLAKAGMPTASPSRPLPQHDDLRRRHEHADAEGPAGSAKVNIKAELQPVTFTVWREQVRGDGIPLTAAFFAPDYFGSAQYVQYFGMVHGAPWAKRAGAEKMPELYNKAEEEAAAKALASGGDAMDKAYRSGAADDRRPGDHPDGQPRSGLRLSQGHQGRALQLLLQHAPGGYQPLAPVSRSASSWRRARAARAWDAGYF